MTCNILDGEFTVIKEIKYKATHSKYRKSILFSFKNLVELVFFMDL
jgi:hypothetical protein